jgi:hypothetical protein
MVKLLEIVMYNFILLSKAFSIYSGLENNLVYLKKSKLIFSLNFNSHSGDISIWSKNNE